LQTETAIGNTVGRSNNKLTQIMNVHNT